MQGSSLNSVLYDAWASCAGQWEKSTFLQQVRDRHRSTRCGTRRWLTVSEMDDKFGEEMATQIRNRKLLDPELCAREVRSHPELPSASQYLTLVEECEVDEHCEEVDKLFSCLDGGRQSSSSSSSRGKANAKKQKRGSHQAVGNSVHRM